MRNLHNLRSRAQGRADNIGQSRVPAGGYHASHPNKKTGRSSTATGSIGRLLTFLFLLLYAAVLLLLLFPLLPLA